MTVNIVNVDEIDLGFRVDQAIALEKQMKLNKLELDTIKAELTTAAYAKMEDRNLKWYQIFGHYGQFNVAYKESFEIDDYVSLVTLLGEKAKAKLTREEKIKYTTEAQFKAALIVLFYGDYSPALTLDQVLQHLSLDDKVIKLLKKKLKGDYVKDKQLLQSVGAQGELEEELDAIRQIKNAELFNRFFAGLTAEEIAKIRKTIFVEESIAVGLEYEK